MASPQIGRVESKEYYSWMRGHHAYKDIFKPVVGTTLTIQRVPENAKDPHAVAIVEDTGRIVGHIPLALSRIVSGPFWKGLTTRQQQKSVENGLIDDLAWNWNFQLLIRFTAEGNIWTDWTNFLWQRDCKEDLKRKRWKNFDWWTEEAEIDQKRQRQSQKAEKLHLICVQIFQDAARCPL